MENKLIIFDPAERARKDISKICSKFDKPIIISENLKTLEIALYEGHKPLVTEFNLACLKKDEIDLFLDTLKKYGTPTIIHTNSQMYKNYLDRLKETKVYSIIRKIPRIGEPILRKHIEFLLSEKDYEEINIVDSEKTRTGMNHRISDYNIRDGNIPLHPYIRIW